MHIPVIVSRLAWFRYWNAPTALEEHVYHIVKIWCCQMLNVYGYTFKLLKVNYTSPQKTKFTNPIMQLSHIPQCIIQNRYVHLSVMSGALWDMSALSICEIDLFYGITLPDGHHNTPTTLCINSTIYLILTQSRICTLNLRQKDPVSILMVKIYETCANR